MIISEKETNGLHKLINYVLERRWSTTQSGPHSTKHTNPTTDMWNLKKLSFEH